LADKTAVRIEGFYCNGDINRGSDARSLLAVSQRRAEIVREKLMEAGLSFSDITTLAYGAGDDPNRCGVKVIKEKRK
jgi:outer membrane protein OmpA-like peptidoglycan-associated protein